MLVRVGVGAGPHDDRRVVVQVQNLIVAQARTQEVSRPRNTIRRFPREVTTRQSKAAIWRERSSPRIGRAWELGNSIGYVAQMSAQNGATTQFESCRVDGTVCDRLATDFRPSYLLLTLSDCIDVS
jgi:hypothetical protein